ncbi:MAG: SpoIIE family protein phosphatase [Phycisphaeraceae bacterium]|nr:SpoIIE family protein phosphatase [Phycisphaerales bacterium]MCB9859470.1 SpoIIE family protein phosphatase [Phycisphaeraceae bacterium]
MTSRQLVEDDPIVESLSISVESNPTTTISIRGSALRLVAVGGPEHPGCEIGDDERVLLGRSSASRVRLADRAVSRRHAMISLSGSRWVLTDLQSRSGTYLNSVPIRPNSPVPLAQGDKIEIGTWAFRVEIPQRVRATPHQSDAAGQTTSALREMIASMRAAHARQLTTQRVGTDIDAPVADIVAPGASHYGESPAETQLPELDRKIDSALEATLNTVLDKVLADIAGADHERATPESIARRRLSLLMDLAAQMHSLDSEQTLAQTLANVLARASTGMTEVLILRDLGQGNGFSVLARARDSRVETIHTHHQNGHSNGSAPPEQTPVRFSLVRNALDGTSAIHPHDPDAAESEASLCVPIRVGRSVVAIIYMHATGALRQPKRMELNDVGLLAESVAHVAGLALANMKRRELDMRQQLLEADLRAARQAQRLLMPAPSGSLGSVRYAFASVPGRLVVGDLLDVLHLPDGRVAVLLGDVADKGAGAGIVMATAQTHLHDQLMQGADVVTAVSSLNRRIAALSHKGDGSLFLSLFVAILDTASRTFEYVDAGHSLWTIAGDDDAPPVPERDGLVIGVDPSFHYGSRMRALIPGARLIVFSDGVVEQPDNTTGERFGIHRARAALRHGAQPAEDVRTLLGTMRLHAKSEQLADDATVVSLTIAGE